MERGQYYQDFMSFIRNTKLDKKTSFSRLLDETRRKREEAGRERARLKEPLFMDPDYLFDNFDKLVKVQIVPSPPKKKKKDFQFIQNLYAQFMKCEETKHRKARRSGRTKPRSLNSSGVVAPAKEPGFHRIQERKVQNKNNSIDRTVLKEQRANSSRNEETTKQKNYLNQLNGKEFSNLLTYGKTFDFSDYQKIKQKLRREEPSRRDSQHNNSYIIQVNNYLNVTQTSSPSSDKLQTFQKNLRNAQKHLRPDSLKKPKPYLKKTVFRP